MAEKQMTVDAEVHAPKAAFVHDNPAVIRNAARAIALNARTLVGLMVPEQVQELANIQQSVDQAKMRLWEAQADARHSVRLILTNLK